MKPAIVVAAAFALSGCVSSSGVYSVAPDVYQISAPTFVQPKMMEDAGEFCLAVNKQALVLGTWSDHYTATSEVTFTCSDGSPRDRAVFTWAFDEYERRVALRRTTPSVPPAVPSDEPFVFPTIKTPRVTLPSLPTSRTTCRKSASDTLTCETTDPYGYSRGN